MRDGTQPIYVEEYRERVEKRIRELVGNHPAIQAIQRGEERGRGDPAPTVTIFVGAA